MLGSARWNFTSPVRARWNFTSPVRLSVTAVVTADVSEVVNTVSVHRVRSGHHWLDGISLFTFSLWPPFCFVDLTGGMLR